MREPLLAGSQQTASLQKRICFVTETYPSEINGVALTLAHLVKGLRAQGHDVSLVHPRRRVSERLGDNCDPRAVLVRGLPLPGYKGLQFGFPASSLLRSRWAHRRPDVVYVATEGPLGWSAVRAAQRLEIPVFSGFHTNFHSYSQYYRAGWLQHVILQYLRAFHNCTKGTLVPSAELRDRLQNLGFHNVFVLGRGVDSQLFSPERRCAALRRRWGAGENDLVALYVGRVAPEKNLGLAVEAYRAMQRCRNSAKFVIVGDGPLNAALQEKHPDFIFCGVRTGEQLAEHYASADVFLFSSETETFGNVTLEAMASGLVVVAYDYAAAKMHITHGETGILAPYGEAKTFIDLAAKLACEPQSLHKIRRQTREHIVSVDWRRIVEKFALLLTGTCGENPIAANASVLRRDMAA